MTKKLSIIKIGTTTCAPCKLQDKILEEFDNVTYVDAEKDPDIAKKFDVIKVPVSLIYDGEEQLARFEGLTTADKIKEVLKGGKRD